MFQPKNMVSFTNLTAHLGNVGYPKYFECWILRCRRHSFCKVLDQIKFTTTKCALLQKIFAQLTKKKVHYR